ncbi:haloacid dehalogenase-like hydrolase [Salmonella enterica subsp. enterica serovar Dublin]|nr:haloacid dehalogenase-like hydrolase [Salmonella enterica subsp. enterica serovar Dublin]
MLYIFDLGNVIVDIDFNRVLGVWSDLSRVPLASLKQKFTMGETFHQHERGEITDEAFAEAFCHEMALSLSYEQFAHGWQAVFVGLRPEVIAIMHKLREQGHRVVVLSNTNRLHTHFWPEEYPEVRAAADHIYLSRIWECVSRKRVFISTSCRKKVFLLPMRSFSTTMPII